MAENEVQQHTLAERQFTTGPVHDSTRHRTGDEQITHGSRRTNPSSYPSDQRNIVTTEKACSGRAKFSGLYDESVLKSFNMFETISRMHNLNETDEIFYINYGILKSYWTQSITMTYF